MRAYKKADKYGPREGLITRSEFRKFLEFLPVYKKLWDYFEKIDLDADRRVDLNEFKAGATHIGLSMNENELEATFKRIDRNGGGQILFDEFCEAMIDEVVRDINEE